MPANPLITNNFIDSCAFDPKYEPETKASNEIFRLYREGSLLIQVAHSTQKELRHPNTPAWVRKEARQLIYSIQVPLTSDENNKLKEIERILAGTGKIDNIRQDARHVFESQKYGSYFVTADHRILSRADALRSACNANVVKPSRFLSLVKQYMNEPNRNKITPPFLTNNTAIMPKSEEEAKTEAVSYNGYVIKAESHQLADSGEWTIGTTIWRETGNQVRTRGFGAAKTFRTREESVKNCINFGRQIIDGKYPDLSVSDL